MEGWQDSAVGGWFTLAERNIPAMKERPDILLFFLRLLCLFVANELWSQG